MQPSTLVAATLILATGTNIIAITRALGGPAVGLFEPQHRTPGTDFHDGTGVIRIRNDRGGDLAAYQTRVVGIRASGQKVIVDGLCASACTVFLTLPRNQICSTARGRFGFHIPTIGGLPERRAGDALFASYPPHVQTIINRRTGGGLWLSSVVVSGRLVVPGCGR